MVPWDLHVGQKIKSFSKAILTPLMLPLLDAEMTFPPAVVVAPSVMVCRLICPYPFTGSIEDLQRNYLTRYTQLVCASAMVRPFRTNAVVRKSYRGDSNDS